MQRDFPQYNESLDTVDRRLRHRDFVIHYKYYGTLLAVVSDAVQKELEEPGLLLGYRTMIQKLRTEFNVQVPRHLVSTGSLDCILKDSRQEAFKDEIKIPKFSLHLNGLSW